MLLDNNYKSSCKFAEDVIAYLYGEIEISEKLRFENHLIGCNSCADELAGFSSVRTSVLEWRNEEFDSLTTPMISIPYEEKIVVHYLADVKESSPSLLSQISSFFGFSNKWIPAAIGFVVLAVFSSLLLFIINSSTNNQIVKNDNSQISNTKAVPTPSNEIIPDETKFASINKEGKEVPKNTDDPKIVNPIKVKSEVLQNPVTPIKVSLPVNSVKINVRSAKTVAINGNKTATKDLDKTSKSRRPTLTETDDDDDSLRLSDLFEEVSLR